MPKSFLSTLRCIWHQPPHSCQPSSALLSPYIGTNAEPVQYERAERPMVRFDFPPGMAAKDIAEALREACKRIMKEKTGGPRSPMKPDDVSGKR